MTKYSFSMILLVAGCLGVAGCTSSATPTVLPVAVAPTGPPVATVVGDTTIQAGEVEYGLQRDYPFRIQNTGGSPLTLTTTYKSCQCAASEVPESIAPGQEGVIKIRWAPIPGSIPGIDMGKYTVTLKVQTNEPRELTFQIQSFVKSKIRVTLPQNRSYIDFENPLQPDVVNTRDVKVFSPDLISFNLEAHCSVEGFTVVKTALPPDSRIGDTIARSGYVVSLSTTNKLPPGYIHGELSLTMTAEGEQERKIVVDVYANRSNPEFGVTTQGGQIVFNKPTISEADSKDVLIQFFGVPSPTDTLELVDFEPKWLKVSPPQRKNAKGLWQLSVAIPADNAEAKAWQPLSFMEGQIVLKSNKTTAPVAIRLKWDPSAR